MDMFEQILALTEDRTVRMALALAAVLLLILVFAAIYRRIARRGLSTKRGRVARLAILEAIPVDQRRRLVLLRRDNTEHLVMIGGPTDLVVEEGIHRQARQPASKRPVPERAVPERTAPERATPEMSVPDRATPEPTDVPRVPIGAKLSEPVETPKPVTPVPEVRHTPAPSPAPAAKPIAPVIPAAIAATAILPDTGTTPTTAPEATESLKAVADPLGETIEEDPQIAEMERKLQDALKAPTPDETDARVGDDTPDSPDLEMPDLESSLQAAIANAVASDATDASPEQPGDGETGTLSEGLENTGSGKSPSG